MKKSYMVAGGVITVLATAYFVRASLTHWEAIKATELNAGMWWAMSGAAGLYAFTFLISAKTWQLTLRCFDVDLPFKKSAEIQFVSQFAKYLPGNVGHHVGKLLLARETGLATAAVVGSIFLDSVMVMLAAVVCSTPSYSLIVDVASAQTMRLGWFCIAFLVLGSVFGVIAWIYRHRWFGPVAKLFAASRRPLLMRAGLFHCASFLFGGLALLMLLSPFSRDLLDWWALPKIVGVYSAAWLLGFIVPGAPAGLGVREVCLLLGLGPVAGHDNALVAAALLRVVTTSTDGVVFSLGLLIRRMSRESPRVS